MATQNSTNVKKRPRSKDEDDASDTTSKLRQKMTESVQESTIVKDQGPDTLLPSHDQSTMQIVPLGEFEIPESEVRITGLIGTGDHAIVYRIVARDQTFALKVHKYDIESISSPGLPKSNPLFNNEISAYSRLSILNSPSVIPKCYGYLKLSKPPQVHTPGSIPRHLFKSKRFRPAVYTDFLICQEPDEREQGYQEDDRWKEYFKNKSGGFILQGLVLDEITTATPLGGEYRLVINHDTVKSGRDGLKAIHKCGVIHGDVKNTMNSLLLAEGGIVWIDFSLAEDISNLGQSMFLKRAAREIRIWDHIFRNIAKK